jgi:hypothetical protein
MDIFPGGITANFNANALLSCRNRIYFQDTNFVFVLSETVLVLVIGFTRSRIDYDARARARARTLFCEPDESGGP